VSNDQVRTLRAVSLLTSVRTPLCIRPMRLSFTEVSYAVGFILIDDILGAGFELLCCVEEHEQDGCYRSGLERILTDPQVIRFSRRVALI
jgi:hypothetical protein